MTEVLCFACQAWRLHPADRFCGHCGELQLKASATVTPSIVYDHFRIPEDFMVMITRESGNLENSRFFWRKMGNGGEENKEIHLDNLHFNSSSDQILERKFPFDDLITSDQDKSSEWTLIHEVMSNLERPLATVSVGRQLPELALLESDILLKHSGNSHIVLKLCNKQGDPFNIIKFHLFPADGRLGGILPVLVNASSVKLSVGETLDLQLQLPEVLIKQLDNTPTGLSYFLALESLDFPEEAGPLRVGQFNLRMPKPAMPVLHLPPDRVRVLSGHPGNFALNIENQGGDAFSVDAFKYQIIANGMETLEGQVEIQPRSLEMAERYSMKTCPVPLQTLSAGLYLLKLHMVSEGVPVGEGQQLELEVIEAMPYRGVVVIDFGTTASAAACYDRKGNPKEIPLSDLDTRARYIPTAIAYYLENNTLKFCIGEQAQAKRDDLSASKVRYLDNIKWRLGDGEDILLPDASYKRYWEVAADYLSAIKTRIEVAPEVMANVNKVCITQPARFDPQLAALLARAYRQAGMEPMVIYSGERKIASISESWPSSMLSLTSVGMQDWQRDFMGDQWSSAIGNYLWINIDMGGGSTDFSIMSMDIPDRASIYVKEIASDGDNTIAGNFISELIFHHIHFYPPHQQQEPNISDDAVFASIPQELEVALYPQLLPWQSNQAQTNNTIARINGQRIFEQIIFPLQKSTGTPAREQQGIIERLYLDFKAAVDEAGLNEIFSQLWVEDAVADRLQQEEFKDILRNFVDTLKYEAEQELSITLVDIHGNEIVLKDNSISFDVKNFLIDFSSQVSVPLFRKLKRLFESTTLDQRELVLVASGRGSLFPLVVWIMDAYKDALLASVDSPSDQHVVHRLLGDRAKTIVCSGGCHIGALLSRGKQFQDNTIFEPSPLPEFGIENGIDRDTGASVFLSLSQGIPHSEDGWIAVPYEVCPGYHDLTITFCQNPENTATIQLDENTLMGNISGSIEFTEKLANTTYLLVRMLPSGLLEAWIAVPSVEDAENYDAWDKQLLGTLQVFTESEIA